MAFKRFSYSAIKLFDTCPAKYEAQYITKETGYEETEATIYGTALHLAAEEYIRDGKELEPRFEYIKPILDKLNNIPGEKHCELKMGLALVDGRFVSCDYNNPNASFRGIADLIIVDEDKGVAWICDYKSSKSSRYADSKQLALMAACVFAKWPEVKKVKAALLFVVCSDVVKSEYVREEGFNIFAELNPLITQREAAYASGVFNPKPNGLCGKWCGVLSCAHNGRNR